MYKIERILCPTDFSPASIEAIRFASFLASHSGCQLTLMYVDEEEKPRWGITKKTNIP
jgi:nucleotide-binding universal stress UspA family protein